MKDVNFETLATGLHVTGARALTASEIRRIAMAPQAGDMMCWLKAIFYLMTTGDILGAVGKALECLMGTNRRSLEDVMECLLRFFQELVEGKDWVTAAVNLFVCIFTGPAPPPTPPPPGPPSGEVPEFRPNPVTRCG